jgi:DNA-binding transcriptional regulator/RsmH inhibitor MraZ
MTNVDAEVGVHPRNRAATYRAYHLDNAGRITMPGLVFEASDDVTAITRAHALMGGGNRLEIWKGSRRIGSIGDSDERH